MLNLLYIHRRTRMHLGNQNRLLCYQHQAPRKRFLWIFYPVGGLIVCIRHHGLLTVAICGNASFNVSSIDPKSIRLSFDGGKKEIKPSIGVIGMLQRQVIKIVVAMVTDLKLMFINPQVIHVFRLCKHPGNTIFFTIIGTLKTTFLPVEGHDSVLMGRDLRMKKS